MNEQYFRQGLWRIRALCLGLCLLPGVVPSSWAQTAAPKVTLDATSQAFGKVSRGSLVTKTFRIGNAGTAPLKLLGMRFSSPGMRARVSATIAPGATAPLEIEWDTSHYSREVSGEAVLKLNDPETPEIALRLTGFVVSPIDVDPVPAFYLSQFRGEASSQTVTIRNNQDRDVHVTGIQRNGKNFTIAFKPLEPGRTYAVTATGSPQAPLGRHTESAVVMTDDPERTKIRLAVNLLVKGDVHASAEAIDMGRIRRAVVKANPGLLDLLEKTVILESRAPAMRITALESDLPFLTLHRIPEGSSKRVRIDVGLDLDKLTLGEHRGVVRIHTDVRTVPEITLPVHLTAVK